MHLPFGKSEKEKTIRRAKALVELLLPCLVLAVVVLSSRFTHARPAPAASKVTSENQTRQDGWLAAKTASSADASLEIRQSPQVLPWGKNGEATTVRVMTYTVYPTY